MNKLLIITTLLLITIPIATAENITYNFPYLSRYLELNNRTTAGGGDYNSAPQGREVPDPFHEDTADWYAYDGSAVYVADPFPTTQDNTDWGFEFTNSSALYLNPDNYIQDTGSLYFYGQTIDQTTIMQWILISEAEAKPQHFFSAGTAGNNLAIAYDTTAQEYRVIVDSVDEITYAWTWDNTTWNHIAITLNQAELTLWLNWTNVSHTTLAGPVSFSRAITSPYYEGSPPNDAAGYMASMQKVLNMSINETGLHYYATHSQLVPYAPNLTTTYINFTDNGDTTYFYNCSANFSVHNSMPIPGNITLYENYQPIYTNYTNFTNGSTIIEYNMTGGNNFQNFSCRADITEFGNTIGLGGPLISEGSITEDLWNKKFIAEDNQGTNITNFTLTVNGLTYNTNESEIWINLPIGTHTVIGESEGYVTQTWNIETYTLEYTVIVLNFTPATFGFYFVPPSNDTGKSEIGRFLVGDPDCTERWDCKWFNATYIIMNSTELHDGDIVMAFNPTSYNYLAWWQSIGFQNNRNQHINMTIISDYPDLALDIFAGENSLPIDNAQICVESWFNGTNYTWADGVEQYWPTFCDLTDNSGIANLMVNDEIEYRICAYADNYYSKCIPSYVIPLTEDIYKIELEPLEDYTANSYRYTSTCGPHYTQKTNCTLTLYTPRDWSQLCILISINGLHIPAWDTCTYSTGFLNTTFELSDTIQNYTFNATISDASTTYLVASLFTEYNNITYAKPINLEVTDDEGTRLIDILEGNQTYLNTVYMLVVLLTIVIYWLTEKYFPTNGIYGVAMFLLVFVQQGLIYFIVPIILIGLRGILMAIRPLVKT